LRHQYSFSPGSNSSYQWVTKLPLKKPGGRTLEVGAGLGAHLEFEDLLSQEYYCLEMRQDFCRQIEKKLPAKLGKTRVVCGSIEQPQPWPDGYFDRILTIHVLEHLRDLPRALQEISRLLAPDGCLDVVIPCEGGVAYNVARNISAKRFFEKRFRMSYDPIVKNEHVNTYAEVIGELQRYFKATKSSYFPLKIPVPTLNLCMGTRLVKN
jgi:SAM-dependent methyltransferase